MMRAMNRFGAAALLSGLALPLAGCAVDRAADEDVGKAQTAQLDPGDRDYLVYTIWQNSAQIGKVLVTATKGAGYDEAVEYWYMTSNASMGSSLTFSAEGGDYWADPPSGLGTLSFTM